MRYRQRLCKDGKYRLFPLSESAGPRVHMIVDDIQDYKSPVTGEVVSGRKQRREDLKRAGCVEYDRGMKRTAHEHRETQLNKATDRMIDVMRWVNA